MLRVVDGGGKPEPDDEATAEPESRSVSRPQRDDAAPRDLVRSTLVPRADPLSELTMRATQGDDAAMADLLRSVSMPLLAAVRAIAGRETADVEDIAQETMVAFVQALPAFRGECSVTHYASRIALRTAMAARKRRTLRENRADAMMSDVRDEIWAASPGEEAWAARRRDALRTLLEELP